MGKWYIRGILKEITHTHFALSSVITYIRCAFMSFRPLKCGGDNITYRYKHVMCFVNDNEMLKRTNEGH